MKKKKIELDAKKELGKVKKLGGDFKSFISRGNVVDMAVGVIIGGAFGKIVTSLVNDVLTPIIGVFLGGLNFNISYIPFHKIVSFPLNQAYYTTKTHIYTRKKND